MPLIVFGDAKFLTTMRGKRAGLSRVLFRKLKQLERCGRVKVVQVDEYLSSQVCSKCLGGDKLEKVNGVYGSLHAVLKCKKCCPASNGDVTEYYPTLWNRDVNASRNLRMIAMYMASHNNQRPKISYSQSLSMNNPDNHVSHPSMSGLDLTLPKEEAL